MRRIRTFLEVLSRQFINDAKINVIILCTLILTFSFVFIISGDIVSKFLEYGKMNVAVRTYEIRLAGANSVESYDSIFKEFINKRIEKITHLNLSAKNSVIRHFDVAFDHQHTNLYPHTNNTIILGRNFSNSELLYGLNVIILSQKDYSKYYSNYKLGDIVQFADYDFRFIGIHNEDKISGPIIPYNTVLKLSKGNENNFRVNEAFILMEERLNKKEIRAVVRSAKNHLNYDTDYQITTSSSWMKDSILKNTSGSVISAFIVIVFSSLNIINLLRIIHFRNKNVMKIYRVLGYEDKYIAFNFIVILVVLTIISVILGSYLAGPIGSYIKQITAVY